jgi:hypothetical protein
MRKLLWLTAAALVAFGGCKDQGDNTTPKLDSDRTATRNQHNQVEGQRDAVLGPEGRASAKDTEAADKTANRVQVQDKAGTQPEQLRDEHAQAADQKTASEQTTGGAVNDAKPANALAAQPDLKGATADSRSVSGTISKVRDDQIELKSSDKLDLKLAVDATTAISIDGQAGGAAQIREGSQVRATYRPGDDGNLKAVTLDVTSAGAPAK